MTDTEIPKPTLPEVIAAMVASIELVGRDNVRANWRRFWWARDLLEYTDAHRNFYPHSPLRGLEPGDAMRGFVQIYYLQQAIAAGDYPFVVPDHLTDELERRLKIWEDYEVGAAQAKKRQEIKHVLEDSPFGSDDEPTEKPTEPTSDLAAFEGAAMVLQMNAGHTANRILALICADHLEAIKLLGFYELVKLARLAAKSNILILEE